MSARERADWLLDAVAMATQDRRYLRGDPQYDEVAGAAILMNGEKAILAAVRAALEEAAEAIYWLTPECGNAYHKVRGLITRLDAEGKE